MASSDQNEEVIDRVSELTEYFELWWDLSNRENEHVYRPVFEQYGRFFSTTTHALLQGFAVVAYQLFETRPDSHSIPALLRQLEKSDPALALEIRGKLERHRPVLGKVFALRNKVYAHRSASESPETVFGNAGITPNEMREIVALSQQLAADLAETNGGYSREEVIGRYHAQASRIREQSQALLVRLHADGR